MTVNWALERLCQLRTDYADGETQLVQLEHQRARLQEGLLRVGGAIEVLEELIAASGAFDADVDLARSPGP